MALTSNESDIELSTGENVASVNTDDDLVKSITNEIIEILELDNEDEEGDQIIKDLLENGRQSLVKYHADIIPRVYNEEMNGNDTKLMNTLKKYFQQKWEIQYGSSNPWFISFIKEYENGDNHDIYESILTRTAQYGNKYMKDYPLLSILLQLFFESIDDNCLEETNNIFDNLWANITNDGLQSITKYSDYIVGKVLNEQLKKDSILFQALREYYRPNVLVSLTQSSIAKKQNFYELALDDVVEHGWLSDMKSLENDVPPKRHKVLLENLSSFHKKQSTPQNQVPDILPSVPTLSDNESNVSEDPKDIPDSTNNTRVISKDTIFISGLPTTLSKQVLSDKLKNVFSTCGDIKILPLTNKPNICLFTQKDNKSQLSVTASIRFEKEESATNAIEKYNGKQIPALNDTRIKVGLYRNKPESKRQQNPIHINNNRHQSERDESGGLNSSANNAGARKISDMNDTSTFSKDRIYITGLPTSMSEQELFDTVDNVFSTVGQIKINKQTSKPFIKIIKSKGLNSQLLDAAQVTFTNENSVTKAIEKYHGKQIPALKNNQLCVERSKLKAHEITRPSELKAQPPQVSLISTCRPEGQPDGPVSIFWDIENVAIPTESNAYDIIMKLRKRLIEDRKLVQGSFKTYARDIDNIPIHHRRNLHHADVTVQHIESNKSGAVDMQIHKDIRTFIDQHKTPSTLVLISGDIDFIHDITELRFGKRHYTIVIHNPQAKDQLLKAANEFISWDEFLDKKCLPKPNQQSTVRTTKKIPKETNQVQMSSIDLPKENSARCPSPRNKLGNNRITTPVSKCSPLMNLKIDKSARNTNNDASRPSSAVAAASKRESLSYNTKEPDASKNGARTRRRRRKTETGPDGQPLKPLMSLVTNSSNPTIAGGNSSVAPEKKSEKPKKREKVDEAAKIFSCSMCDKKFVNDIGRTQHEQSKHKIGTLVEISSTMPTSDTPNHSQPSEHENQPSLDLIAFDSDNDDYDLSQPNLPMTTIETGGEFEFSDDDSNSSESSSELSDSAQLEKNSPDYEKVIESDVFDYTNKDD